MTNINNWQSELETIDRIVLMEQYYDTLYEALSKKKRLENFDDEEREMLSQLIEYYEGGQWLRDYEADEQGLIPTNLKRGILAQDTLYDFFYCND